LQEIEADLKDMGYQIIAITTDQPSKIRETIDKHTLTYTVVSDHEMRVATAFGIAWYAPEKMIVRYKSYGMDLVESAGSDHGILPVPAVFLVGTDGVIHFQYVNPNHRVRLHKDVMFAVAKAAMEMMSE